MVLIFPYFRESFVTVWRFRGSFISQIGLQTIHQRLPWQKHVITEKIRYLDSISIRRWICLYIDKNTYISEDLKSNDFSCKSDNTDTTKIPESAALSLLSTLNKYYPFKINVCPESTKILNMTHYFWKVFYPIQVNDLIKWTISPYVDIDLRWNCFRQVLF